MNLDDCKNIDVLEELLASCYSLEKLVIQHATIGPKMAAGIRQNCKTLQILNLYYSFVQQNSYLDIIRDCQKLTEVYFGRIKLSYEDLKVLAKNISPKVEIMDLRVKNHGIGFSTDPQKPGWVIHHYPTDRSLW